MTHPATITHDGRTARLEAVDGAGCCDLYKLSDGSLLLRREGAPLLDWGLGDDGQPWRTLHGPWRVSGSVRKAIAKVDTRPRPTRNDLGFNDGGPRELMPYNVPRTPGQRDRRANAIDERITSRQPRRANVRGRATDLDLRSDGVSVVEGALAAAPYHRLLPTIQAAHTTFRLVATSGPDGAQAGLYEGTLADGGRHWVIQYIGRLTDGTMFDVEGVRPRKSPYGDGSWTARSGRTFQTFERYKSAQPAAIDVGSRLFKRVAVNNDESEALYTGDGRGFLRRHRGRILGWTHRQGEPRDPEYGTWTFDASTRPARFY